MIRESESRLGAFWTDGNTFKLKIEIMSETNPNARLEMFCDGVFAIALTLLIIDVKIPATIRINNTAALWLELKNILPSIYAVCERVVVAIGCFYSVPHVFNRRIHFNRPCCTGGYYLQSRAYPPGVFLGVNMYCRS
jgi:hypothetical protein